MKAAIIGAGGIAHFHAAALAANGISLATVVNQNLEKARLFAHKWNVPNYSSDPTTLFDSSIDCVHVCTPPAIHYPFLLELFRSGKHILCEKPLCLTNEEADHLVSLWQQSNQVCAVNFNVRHYPACQRMKHEVETGQLGALRLVHGNYLQSFHALPAPDGWRYNPALAGPLRAVTEIGSHWLDLAQYITGKSIIAVSAVLQHHHPLRQVKGGFHYPVNNGLEHSDDQVSVESEDTALIHLRFDNGLLGSLVLSEVSQGRQNHISIEITGDIKNLWWNGESSHLLNSATINKEAQQWLDPFGSGFLGTFTDLVKNVYQAIKEGPDSKAVYPHFGDGRRSVILCNAIAESHKNSGKWVTT